MIHTTRYFHRTLIVLVLELLICSLASAQTPTPFDCQTGLGYILTNVNPGGGNVTSLHSFNLSDGTDVLIKSDILPAPNRFLNAFGYNSVDNFLYGFRYGTSQIAKVGSNGEVEILDVTGLNSSGQYATGDVSTGGILYLHGTIGGSGSVIAIDLNPASANYLVAQSQSVTNIDLLLGLNDWAFNPVDGLIYGMATDHSLIRYDPTTNVVTSLGVAGGLTGETGAFGSAFMDSQGAGYVGNNASGNLYKINPPASVGDPYTAELFSNSLAGKSPGDGARCALQPVPPAANINLACVEEGRVLPLPINVVENDGEGSFPIDLESLVLIDPVSMDEVSTVTITGQGTFTVVPNTGIVTFSAEPGFSLTEVKYKISDTQGNQSGNATIFVSICGLPVKLSEIKASNYEQTILVEWKTTLEVNFDRFEVERSEGTGRNFTTLGIVESQKEGALYSYQDKTIQPNIIYYYRLKMVDTDGTYAYSKLIAAKWEKDRVVVAAPNPAHRFVRVTSDQPIETYQLVSPNGTQIFSKSAGASYNLTINLQNMQVGNYLLKLVLTSGVVVTKILVIQ